MATPTLGDVVSHWYHLFEGLQQEPADFYQRLGVALENRKLPNAKYGQVELAQGGVFAGRRLYFRARRKEYTFDICGAPFGNGFFVSWWLSEPQGCLALLSELPVIGVIFALFRSRVTYYKIDTQLMFQESVHRAVLDVLDEITTAQGVRAMSEDDRKPIIRGLLPGKG